MPQSERRSFCRTLAVGAAGMRLAPAAPALPNIVYILADDLGWGDLGCYNPQSAVPTPHADRLAAQSVRFTDMHSPSAVCTPTRYGILTGRYCWRSRLKQGVLIGYDPDLIEPGSMTAPAMLKSRGGEKAEIWDGGHRIPFMARWPGHIAPNTVTAELGCLTDFMGTAAEVIGYKLPRTAGEDSYSLLPALLGKKGKPIREAVVHHSNLGIFGIRQGDWKVELGLGSGGFSDSRTEEPSAGGPQGQLYNLASDPKEENNLWQERPDQVARLTALLEKYKAESRSRPV
jgi:arylsulfatase A-like enzyme